MARRRKHTKSAVQDLRRPTEYYDYDTLENWQRLVEDLGIRGSYSSKTKCKKVIGTVWVNIADFVQAVEDGTPVQRFRNRNDLLEYTFDNNLTYPRAKIVRGSPLAALMKEIY